MWVRLVIGSFLLVSLLYLLLKLRAQGIDAVMRDPATLCIILVLQCLIAFMLVVSLVFPEEGFNTRTIDEQMVLILIIAAAGFALVMWYFCSWCSAKVVAYKETQERKKQKGKNPYKDRQKA